MKYNCAKTTEQWKVIYDFLLQCGNASNPEAFAKSIIEHIDSLCSYDAASVYLLSPSGKVTGQYLRNIDEKWIKIYLAYYINTDEQRYSLQNSSARCRSKVPFIRFHNWLTEKSTEFIPDFIRIRGLTYSCGFGLYDLQQRCRMSVALDRTGDIDFSQEEAERLRTALPLLNAMHKNFYYDRYMSGNVTKHNASTPLTVRESQITALLCQSFSPAEISRTLSIAQSTTYKHIANIYKKLNVSSQRELLSVLLNDPEVR